MFALQFLLSSASGVVQKFPNHDDDRLQLVFSFGGKRHYLSTGYPDTPQYRKLAQMRASEIEKDILYERFNPTLEKYKPKSALSTVTPITPISSPKPTLAELCVKYVDWKCPPYAPSTMKNQYQAFSTYLKRMPTHDLDRVIEIRDHALQTIRIQRNHIGCAFLVWVQLNALAKQAGQTLYQLKHGLLDDYPCQQLKRPPLRMSFA